MSPTTLTTSAQNKVIRVTTHSDSVGDLANVIQGEYPMLTLYPNDMLLYATKVRTALIQKNVHCEYVHRDLHAGDTQTPDYLKLNPDAVVPTLVHDGRVIIESTVICEYINDQWSEPPLKPADSFGRAQMRL